MAHPPSPPSADRALAVPWQWSRDADEAVQTLTGHEMTVSAIDVSPGETIERGVAGVCGALTAEGWEADETRLCSGSRDCTVRVWDLTTGRAISQKRISRNLVRSSRYPSPPSIPPHF
jgi:WD40 repeat protein